MCLYLSQSKGNSKKKEKIYFVRQKGLFQSIRDRESAPTQINDKTKKNTKLRENDLSDVIISRQRATMLAGLARVNYSNDGINCEWGAICQST